MALPLVYLQPQAGTTAPGGILGGGAITNVGTISHPTVTYGNVTGLGVRRTNFSGSTAAGSGCGFTQAGTYWYGNSDTDGFDISVTFVDPSAIAVGESAFIGVMASVAALAGDAKSQTNMIGIGYDSGDATTASWSYYTNASGTATKTAIPGMARNAILGDVITLRIRSVNVGTVNISVKDESTLVANTYGKVLLDVDVGSGTFAPTATTNVPAVETLLGFAFNKYNGAVAAASQLQLVKFVAGSVA
jgi:hypothetical protein